MDAHIASSTRSAIGIPSAAKRQNKYGYKPLNTQMDAIHLGLHIVLRHSGSWGPGENLFSFNLLTADVEYLQHTCPRFAAPTGGLSKELCTGPMLATNVNPIVTAKYAAFRQRHQPSTPSGLKSYIASARTSILRQLAAGRRPRFQRQRAGHTANKPGHCWTGTRRSR